MAQHPNVVLIMADQHHAGMATFYGDPLVQTPAIDSLAARGATFDAAYTPSPLRPGGGGAARRLPRAPHRGVGQRRAAALRLAYLRAQFSRCRIPHNPVRQDALRRSR